MSMHDNKEDIKLFPGTIKKCLSCSEIVQCHHKLGYFTITFVLLKKNASVSFTQLSHILVRDPLRQSTDTNLLYKY